MEVISACGSLSDAAIGTLTGSAVYDVCGGDTISISANGLPSSTVDVQYVVQRELCGDGEALVQVLSVSGGLAGLELRLDNSSGSVKAGLKTSLGNNVQRFSRTQTNAPQTTNNLSALGHKWLKLARSGSTITTYVSSNGTSWNQAGVHVLSNLPSCVQVGVLMQSINNNTTHTGVFSDLVFNTFTNPQGPITTLSFDQDSLSAQPGDTIQVCVNIENPCVCSPTSVDVVLQGNGLPHLANYTSQSLTFTGANASQACFGLPTTNASASGTYSLSLQNISGGNGAVGIAPQELQIQLQGSTPPNTNDLFCGVYSKKAPNLDSLSSDPAFIFKDRFDNAFLREELMPNASQIICVDAGHFILETPVEGVITPSQIATICAAFNYVSSLIESQRDDIPIRIVFTDAITLGGSNVLGAASAVYRHNLQSNGCGQEDNLLWEMMNLGLDYSQQYAYNYIAGYIAFNSSQPWHTLEDDLAGSNPVASTKIDLYSVTVHELLHLLGISSRIGINGVPINGIYSRWDQFLHRSPQMLPLLVDAGGVDCCDEHTYNPLLPALNPNGVDDCTNHYSFIAPNLTATVRSVYPPNFFNTQEALLLNQLSHIDRECDGMPYVMHASLSLGTANRLITETELDILCRLGYTRTSGQSTNCNTACEVIAASDGVYLTPSATINLSVLDDILNNDIYDPEDYQLELTNCGNQNITITDNSNGTYTIGGLEAGQEYGICYSLIGCDGASCDEGYIYVYRTNTTPFLYPEEVACNSGDNLFSLGDFESFVIEPGSVVGGFPRAFYYQQIDIEVCNPFDIAGISGNTVDVLAQDANQFGAIAGIRDISLIRQNIESMFIPLSEPIKPGCSAEISFRHRLAPNITPLGNLQIFATQNQPCLSQGTPNCFDAVLSDDWHCVQNSIAVNSSEWQTTPLISWTNDTGEPINYLIIVNNVLVTGIPKHVHIDDIVVTERCNEVVITPDAVEVCPDDELLTVDIEVCITGNFTPQGGIDLLLEADLSNTPLINVLDGGGFLNAQAAINDLIAGGDCAQLTLLLDVSGVTLADGDAISVLFRTNGQAICSEDMPLAIQIQEEPATPVLAVEDNDCGQVSFSLSGLQPGDEWVGIDYGDGSSGLDLFHTYPEGIYTAVATVNNACGTPAQAEVTLSVEIEETPNPAFGYTANCGEVSFSIAGGLPPGATIVYGGGSPTSGSSLTHTYAEGGTYTATLLIPYVCGTAEIPLTVVTPNCLGCEECNLANTIGTPGATTLMSTVGALPSGAQRCIEGTLVIDQNSNFDYCQFKMRPKSRILIKDGKTLGVGNSHFEGCDQMWRGIELEARAQLKMSGSYIADAQYGLYLTAGGNQQTRTSAGVSGTTFKDNFVGIYATASASPFLYLGSFGNVFISDGVLLPAYSGQTATPESLPELNGRSLAGVVAYNYAELRSQQNRYENLISGILLDRSSGVVFEDKFINIRDAQGAYPGFQSAGVYSRGNGAQTLRVEKTNMSNCMLGIGSGFTRLTALANMMVDMDHGIWASLANTGGIEIGKEPTSLEVPQGNTIKASQTGVIVGHSDPNGLVSIKHNDISINTPEGSNWGVGVFLFFNKSPSTVAYNEITVEAYGKGVYLLDAKQANILDNIIDIGSENAYAGILLEYARGCKIKENEVRGAGISGTQNYGMSLISSMDNAYCCNTFENTRVGVFVEGGSQASNNFSGNSFSSHALSLSLTKDAILGTQEHRENKWLLASGLAEYQAGSEQAQVYPFLVDVTGPNGSAENRPQIYFPVEWFENPENFNIPIDLCLETNCIPTGFKPDDPDTKRLALGEGVSGDYAATTRWELQRLLYRDMQGVLNPDTTITAFMAQAELGSLGGLYTLEQSLDSLFQKHAANAEDMRSQWTEIDDKLQSLLWLDSAYLAATSPVEEAALTTDIIQQQAAVDSLTRGLFIADSLIFADITAELPALFALQAAVVDSFTYERHALIVRELYFNFLSRKFSHLTTTELATLADIADLCPLSDGNAVFEARALLLLATGEAVAYSDSLLCSNNQALRMPVSTTAIAKSPSGLVIYPNPVTSLVNINWVDEPSEEGTHLVVWDWMGRKHTSFNLDKGTTVCQLDASTYPPGIYFIEIKVGAERLQGRFLVQH